jgi:hypothetical protein
MASKVLLSTPPLLSEDGNNASGRRDKGGIDGKRWHVDTFARPMQDVRRNFSQ